ncbi:hypothetical protein [Kitasatospora sp. NPDC094015]|uniref:hypothetical protein n=1 Tax=Kitasatospora sp. NPDC094015 TaxID=3155205 RepID=UPI00331FA578
MSPQTPPPDPNRPRDDTLHVHINADANGNARVVQAGRDQHFHITVPLIGAALIACLLAWVFRAPLEQVVAAIDTPTASASARQHADGSPKSDLSPQPIFTVAHPYPSAPPPSPPPEPSPTPSPTPTPSPAPDPLDEAFAAVRAGDCIDRYLTGLGSYSRTAPVVVDCHGGSALNRISVIATSAATCPTGNGRDAFTHTNGDHSTTVLCLERQFRKGQCFLATTPDYQHYTGYLTTVFSCQPAKIPNSSNVVMGISDIITNWDSCPPLKAGWHTAEWTVLDGSTKVCAAVLYTS